MDGRRVRKRRHTWIPLVILLFTVAGCLVYGFCIYNGYLLLNYPSKSRYPVSGVDLSRYQGNVDWEVLARQDIEFAYIKATEGSSHIDETFAKESLFARLAGVWHIDGEMTNGHLEQYGKEYHSLQEMFGTGIQYGSELKIQEDGTIEYFIGIGNGGSGQGESADGEITVTITPMEGHSESEEILTLREETIESRMYLVMEYYGEELFWSLSH